MLKITVKILKIELLKMVKILKKVLIIFKKLNNILKKRPKNFEKLQKILKNYQNFEKTTKLLRLLPGSNRSDQINFQRLAFPASQNGQYIFLNDLIFEKMKKNDIKFI